MPHLELDAQFGHSISLKCFVLLVVEVHARQRCSLIGARDGEGGSCIA